MEEGMVGGKERGSYKDGGRQGSKEGAPQCGRGRRRHLWPSCPAPRIRRSPGPGQARASPRLAAAFLPRRSRSGATMTGFGRRVGPPPPPVARRKPGNPARRGRSRPHRPAPRPERDCACARSGPQGAEPRLPRSACPAHRADSLLGAPLPRWAGILGESSQVSPKICVATTVLNQQFAATSPLLVLCVSPGGPSLPSSLYKSHTFPCRPAQMPFSFHEAL